MNIHLETIRQRLDLLFFFHVNYYIITCILQLAENNLLPFRQFLCFFIVENVFQDLVKKMLHVDPGRRITAAQV